MNDQSQDYQATLLFVDDEKNILSSLRRLFRSEGYRLLEATSGMEGLEVIRNNTVDLVISDMRMPEMTGAEFLAEVAEKWPDIVRIILTGYADLSSTVDAINKGQIYKYISKPWEDNDIKLNVKHALEKKYLELERQRLLALTQEQNEELKDLNANLEDKVRVRTAELHKAHESLKKNFFILVRSFSNLIEMREGHSNGHSRRVANKSHKLALKMGLGETEAQDVLYAGLLHMIGMIGMPDNFFSQPFNTLSPEERVTVSKSPIIGQGILMGLGPLQGAANLIRSYRECYDGFGYPDGLEGDAIPLGARILSVVCDYDLLLIGKISTTKLSAKDAAEYIRRHRGKQYDPEVINQFFDMEFGEGTQRKAEIQMPPRLMIPGMVLSRDVTTSDGALLLSEGHVLDEKLIEKLSGFEDEMNGKLEVFVINRGYETEVK
jgi:response regulator RpfG family c-di-GMP phosphodiesterase